MSGPTNPSHAFAAILADCLGSGFVLPLHVVTVALNGAVIVSHYEATDEGSMKMTPLVQHKTDGMMVLPINVFIVDARGEAARVRVGSDGKPEKVH